MKTLKVFPLILASILLLSIAIPNNHAQGKELQKEIDRLKEEINRLEKRINKFNRHKQLIDSGKYYFIYDEEDYLKIVSKDDYPEVTTKPWEVAAKILAAKKTTKREYEKLLYTLSKNNSELAKKKRELAELERKYNQRHQEGHGYVEVKINQENFSRPSKNVVRWDWQLRFDEINGVGVTINDVWTRGYRGGELKTDNVEFVGLKIEPYGSALLGSASSSKVFMQYGTARDKTSPGKIKYIYSGLDDNGNAVKAEMEITRSPK